VSAPPLPDAFGNYALGDFVEVVSPAGIDWWPQTPGWWVVGAVAAIFLINKAWQRFRRWYRDRYRREALARLAGLQRGDASGAELVRELNTVLKLTAIAANAREQVASLTGEPWPAYLNAQCETPPFDDALTPLLASGSYIDPEIDNTTRAQLFASATAWIRLHRDYHA
jgi:hypothetical protein